MNKVFILGKLGKDVESRFTGDGKQVATFSVAVNENGKNKNGEKTQTTEWFNVVAFDKLAEICQNYLKKGQEVLVEGKIKTQKWQDKEGKTHYKTQVICKEMRMLGGKTVSDEKTSVGNVGNNQNMPESEDQEQIPF